jgi:pimeloyl-ACP methyl ester carboxylesterase
MFNYRGVGISEGTTSRDGLLLDLHAVIDYALAPTEQGGLGIESSNVVVRGHSLGGAVSTLLLAEMVSSTPDLVLCNTRSFSTLKAAASKLVGAQYGEKVGKVASVGISLLRWELDAATSWSKLTTGFKWVESVGDDDIIFPGAKLVDHLQNDSSDAEDHRIIQLAQGDRLSGHNRALRSNEYAARWQMIQEALRSGEGRKEQ